MTKELWVLERPFTSATTPTTISTRKPMIVPGVDSFSKLPTEIISNIFSYLSYNDLSSCLSICREWYYIGNDPLLWHDLDLSNLRSTSLPHFLVPRTLHKHLTTCRSLTIDAPISIGVQHILILLKCASQSPNLRSLSLTSIPNIRSQTKTLEQFFLSTKSQNLQHVDLSKTSISTSVIQALLQTSRKTLKSLNLEFSNIEDPALRAIAQFEVLEHLSLLDCFSLSKPGLRSFLSKRFPASVRVLKICWLPDVRIGWLYELLMKPGNRVEKIDVRGCERLTLGDLRCLQKIKPGLEIVHTALLEEESIWGYRKYIEYLGSLAPPPPLVGVAVQEFKKDSSSSTEQSSMLASTAN
ncbi:hypothetical protein L873DRAFT_1786656 [Choiromyces venosus 120613-1]|uniref:F-box domain-containing protein n=1 Tax=Choiromyces venosus 120613-1 TaxID=1336337 RepID=A0A3N4JZ20_9PEZI|nr:hypothetical protein L873DRAFT_1786656 [Choiromyces venosus 120613-1]